MRRVVLTPGCVQERWLSQSMADRSARVAGMCAAWAQTVSASALAAETRMDENGERYTLAQFVVLA